MTKISQGTYTALITPFKNQKIDFQSFEKILDFQIKSSIDGVVVCGSTGESANISDDEKYDIAKFVIGFAKNRIKVIVGSGSNNTQASAILTKKISELQPEGFLIISPYYNKTTQEGVYNHFKIIASYTDLPIILYNVPSRTNIDIANSTILRLAEIKNIIGLKDATADLSRVLALRSNISQNFLLFSGDDATAFAFNLVGGNGVISVVSNIAPIKMKMLQDASFAKQNLSEFLSLQDDIYKISSVLFAEPNPIPVKYAYFLMGMCQNEYRLPLIEPSEAIKDDVKKILNICK